MPKLNSAQWIYFLGMTLLGALVPFFILGPILFYVRKAVSVHLFRFGLLASVLLGGWISPLLGLSALAIGLAIMSLELFQKVSWHPFFVGVAASVSAVVFLGGFLTSVDSLFATGVIPLMVEQLKNSAVQAKTIIDFKETAEGISLGFLLLGYWGS